VSNDAEGSRRGGGEFVGRFVTEVGVRQAWPFVTLCDNRPTRADELRLYIDADFSVEPARPLPAEVADEVDQWLRALSDLLNRTVTAQRVTATGDLVLTFDDELALSISGTASATTVGEPWWTGGSP
jgi:hypothetical protein